MTDIVERLRRCADKERPYGQVSDVCDDAAAEIERLRAALEEIANGKYSGIVLTSFPPQDPAVNRARAALSGDKQ